MSFHLPVGPLEARACARLERLPRHGRRNHRGDGRFVPAEVLAELVGVSARCWFRWRVDGVPLYAADRAAVALGAHPAELWGTDFYEFEAAS